jgi:hypothetical protein
MIPIVGGKVPSMQIKVKAGKDTVLNYSLRTSQKPENFTPEVILDEQQINISEGESFCDISFSSEIKDPQYVFVTLHANDDLQVLSSETRVTGLLTVFNKFNKSVATSSKQEPPIEIGIDAFEFWVPERRPLGQNLAFKLSEPISAFPKENMSNGIFRPTNQPNAWVADITDEKPTVQLIWSEEQEISNINLYFDTDFDHPMESTLMGHPESEIPFCAKSFLIKDDSGKVIHREDNNHQSIRSINFNEPIKTKSLLIELGKRLAHVPVSLFGITCYGKP